MCYSARLTLAIQGSFTFLLLYLLRINFSIGIVCMTSTVPPTEYLYDQNWTITTSALTTSYKLYSNASAETTSESLIDGAQFCGDLTVKAEKVDGEFYWEKRLRGFMLTAFFWGYIITQVPGGWLATKLGGKHVLGIGMSISVLANILIPSAARLNKYFVIVLRFIMGLCHGVVFPSMHTLWGRWAPPFERSKLIASTYAGTMLGTILAMSVSGFLCEIQVDSGWPFIFYTSGAVGIIWCILWNVLVYNTPANHPRITDREKRYIELSIGSSSADRKVNIPWKSILTSGPMWAILVCHFCNNWGSYTILTSIPTYMKEVLHFDIKSNGMMSALPYICMYFTTMMAGQLADFIRSRRILSTVAVRKTFQTFATLIPSAFIIAVGYMDCDRRYLAVAFLTIAVTFTAFGRCGYSVNHVDIAPRYSGILFGITNTAATLPGMISPYIAAAITQNGTQREWQVVFFICGGVYALGCVVYLIFASGEEQEWAKLSTDKENNVLMIEVKNDNTLTEKC